MPTLAEPSVPVVLIGVLPELDTDCACPTPGSLSSPWQNSTGHWKLVPDLYQAVLNEEWRLFCHPLAGGPPALLNPAAVDRMQQFADPQPLTTAIDTQLATARLLQPELAPPVVPDTQPTILTAWLHITNACNLDCPYCYVRHSSARMSITTGQAAITSLVTTAQRHGMQGLKLKYAGGEATLHFRLVQQLHAYAEAQSQAAGLNLQAVVLSNGTLMPEAFADWLADSGVRLMLSLDGVAETHDAQRPQRGGGRGAFAALEHNLQKHLLPRGIRPDLSITVTGANAQFAGEAVAWALAQGLRFSLNFYREHDRSIGYAQLRLQEEQLIAGMRSAYAVIEQALPDAPLLDGLLDLVRAEAHGQSCGLGRSYVVITHSGRVAQCQMLLEDAALPISAATDLLELVQHGPLQNPHVDLKAGCQDCVWRYRCAGGCPLLTLRATGRSDVQSPNCAIYQALLPAALRLEGLRLLKLATRAARPA